MNKNPSKPLFLMVYMLTALQAASSAFILSLRLETLRESIENQL